MGEGKGRIKKPPPTLFSNRKEQNGKQVNEVEWGENNLERKRQVEKKQRIRQRNRKGEERMKEIEKKEIEKSDR